MINLICASFKAIYMSIWANIRVQLYMKSVNDMDKTLLQWFYDQVIIIDIVCEPNAVTHP